MAARSLGAVLFAKAEEPPIGADAGGPAGVGVEHQGEQPPHLGLVRHELVEYAAQVQRL
jgi:hypothetical protein